MNEADYKVYDDTVSFLIQDIANTTQNSGGIVLENFCPEDNDHMTVYYGALYAGTLFNKKVYVNLPFWKYVKFRLAHRDMKKHYRNTYANNFTMVDVPKEIDKVMRHVKGAEIFTNGIGCIYQEYYAHRKDKE